jgi:hypothetical protein
MVMPSLKSYEPDKERVVFLSSWTFVIGSLMIMMYVAFINLRFCNAVVKALRTPSSKPAAVNSAAASPTEASNGKCQVKIRLNKVEMGDGGSQFHYDWKLGENRSGSRLTPDQKEVLDRKVQCFCKNHVADSNTPEGEHDLVQWF